MEILKSSVFGSLEYIAIPVWVLYEFNDSFFESVMCKIQFSQTYF